MDGKRLRHANLISRRSSFDPVNRVVISDGNRLYGTVGLEEKREPLSPVQADGIDTFESGKLLQVSTRGQFAGQ